MMIDLERGCLAQWWMEWMFLQSQGLTCRARCIQYIPDLVMHNILLRSAKKAPNDMR